MVRINKLPVISLQYCRRMRCTRSSGKSSTSEIRSSSMSSSRMSFSARLSLISRSYMEKGVWPLLNSSSEYFIVMCALVEVNKMGETNALAGAKHAAFARHSYADNFQMIRRIFYLFFGVFSAPHPDSFRDSSRTREVESWNMNFDSKNILKKFIEYSD